MIRQWAMCCAMSMAVTTTVFAAERPLKGPKETLACRLGTEDRHARIAVVLIGGKTSEFAYYTKWKPRTCSIYLQRNRDSYSTWADTGVMTTVNLEKGVVLIEHKKGEYRFEFRDVDRERYCGMDGQINGTLTIRKGHAECELAGIMEEGTPLGYANRSEDEEGEAAGATLLQTTSGAPPATVSVAAPARESADPAPAAVSVVAPARESSAPAPEASDVAAPSTSPPAVSAAAEVTPQATPSSPPPAPPEKAAESGSWNPFRAIFRILTAPRAPEDPPTQ